jgi:hypothetical protein
MVAMKCFMPRLRALIVRFVLGVLLPVLVGSLPLAAQTPNASVAKIEAYYQQLMPTIQQAARLCRLYRRGLRESDQRLFRRKLRR